MVANPVEVRDVILECQNLENLEARLKRIGLNFKDKAESSEELERYWEEAHKEKIFVILNQNPSSSIEDIPYTPVQRGETNYKVHGIPHGARMFIRPSHEFKSFVRERASAYSANAGEDYVCEERFAKQFGLNTEHEMRDITNTLIDSGFANPKLRALTQKTLIYGTYALIALIHQFRLFGDGLFQQGIDIDQKAITNAEWLPIYREYSRARMLPLKLRIELGRLLSPRWYDARSGNMIETDVYRSEYMAFYMQEFAKSKKLHTIHAIVGFGHEEEIVHFISHPEQATKFK